jgi:hypothetical protein
MEIRGFAEETSEELKGVGKKAHSLKDAAARLDVSASHLRNEHKRKRLAFIKSGARTLVSDSELCRYIEQSTIDRQCTNTDSRRYF